MILGEPGSEQYRTRVGGLLLLAGVVLLIWAGSSWIYRTNVPGAFESGASATDGPVDHAANRLTAIRSSPLFVMVALVLIISFFVGSIVIVRVIRGYRDSVLRKAQKATASDDVWAMHRPPRDADEADIYS